MQQCKTPSVMTMESKAGPGRVAQWPSIAGHIAARAGETFMPFMNAHYLYALARAGRGDAVEAALARVHARSTSRRRLSQARMGAGRAPVVEAAAAFGAGDRARAAAFVRSGYADDDSDRRQRRPRRPIPPGLSAQSTGGRPNTPMPRRISTALLRINPAPHSIACWRINRRQRVDCAKKRNRNPRNLTISLR